MADNYPDPPTAKDIQNLTLAICLLTKAIAEQATVDGYRTNAIQSHVPYTNQLSPHAVEETCVILKVETDAIEEQVRKRQ